MKQQAKILTILDFDGTILDSTGAWKGVYQYYCKAHNLTISEEISQFNIPFNKWLETINTKHKLKQSIVSLNDTFNEIAKEIYSNIPPKAGFADYIQYRNNSELKTIIVSREKPDLIKSYLKNYLITGISDVLQDCNQNRSRTSFYIHLSKMYNCNTQDITLIDDSLSHCTTAKQVSAFVIGMNDNHSIERQEQMRLMCELYIDDFATLLKI